MDSEADRRTWAVPPMQGWYDEDETIDLARLDPADEDERRLLIEAEHPELRQAINDDLDTIDSDDGTEIAPRLHISMHEVVANQLWADDPPEMWQAARRLCGLGYERHEVLHMLGSVLTGGVWQILAEVEEFDRERYLAALAALPESWERRRPGGPADPPAPGGQGTPLRSIKAARNRPQHKRRGKRGRRH